MEATHALATIIPDTYNDNQPHPTHPTGDPTVKNPAPRQQEVLDFIRAYRRHHGFPPSRPEIGKALGMAHNSTVGYHLQVLTKKGFIEVRPDTPRGIRILEHELPVVRLGPIGPEEQILAKHRVVEWMAIQVAERFDPAPAFFVAVADDAMNALGINPADLVAVREHPGGEAGQVVVARIGDETILRRHVQIAGTTVQLRPESSNKRHRTITVDLARTTLQIEGVMVGAIVAAHAP